MLKNIELFDKLSLRFNGRVLFIKDVIGDEICCWSFYGQGRKIAEVCCTSIVYATEKKQTKVNMHFDYICSIQHSFMQRAAIFCTNLCIFVNLRLSSLRHESMRRPSTSFCMSLKTMLPLTLLMSDIVWMRTRSENELSDFEGFISNGPMTAHTTTTSDPSPVIQLPVSLTLDSVCTMLVPYNTQHLSLCLPNCYQLF